MRIQAILFAVLILGAGWNATIRGDEPSDGASTTMPADQEQPRPSEPATQPVAGGPESPGILTLKDSSSSGAVWQMVVYTLILLVLGGLAIFVIRRFLPRLGISAGKNVAVLETIHLGPKRTLHLVRVGTRRYLLAGGRDTLNLLADVTEAVPVPSDETPQETEAPSAGAQTPAQRPDVPEDRGSG